MIAPKCFLLPLGLLIASALPAQTTLLNDVFNSASPSPITIASTSTVGAGAQNLPTSATWFMSCAAASNATYTNGSPGTLVVGNPSSVVTLAYFTPASTPQQLNVGDTLTVAFNFSVLGIPGPIPGNGFRLGMFNSGGASNQLTKCTGTGNAFFNNAYAGFGVFVNPNPNQGAATLQQRVSGAGSTLLTTVGTIWTTVATAPSTTPGLTNSQAYQGVFTLNLVSAGTMNISFQINSGGSPVTGYTVTGSSSSSVATAYDTFAIGANSTGMTSFTLTNVNITYTQAQAAAPTFSPVAGTYTAAQSVTISSTTSGASIAYTTDGTTPTETGGTVTHGILYSGPVSLSTTGTLSAIAFKTAMSDSTVTAGLYTFNIPTAATPTFSPVAGTYTVAQSVTISTTTSGAAIAYTTDGSTPTEAGGTVTHGTLYSGPVAINSTATLSAIAFMSGLADSAVASGTYNINIAGVVSAPTFAPPAGSYGSAQSVTISTATGGASIVYTTDGSTPTEAGGTITHGSLYSTPVAISVTSTLKAMAFELGQTDSAVTSGAYTISILVATPVFSPSAGAYTAAQSVTITTATSGASIAYTTDGTTPAETGGTITNGLLYSGAVSISGTTTLNAIAFKNGLSDSTVATGTYTITIPGAISAPAFSVPSGTYSSAQMVSITSATAGVTIRYTIDGSTPTETHGTIYGGPVSITGGSAGSTVQTTLEAIAYEAGDTDSAVTSAVYTIQTSISSVFPSTSGSGGGGALDGWFLGVLAMLGALRWWRARR